MSFSENLRALMQQHGVSQAALGRAVGCAQSSIARIVAGDQDKSTRYTRYAPAIALYFNVSLEELLGTEHVPIHLKQTMNALRQSPGNAPMHAQRAEDPEKLVAIGELPSIANSASMLVVWDRTTPEVPLSPGSVLAIFQHPPTNLAFVAAERNGRIEILQHIHTRLTGSQYYRVGPDKPEIEPDPNVLGPFVIFPVPT